MNLQLVQLRGPAGGSLGLHRDGRVLALAGAPGSAGAVPRTLADLLSGPDAAMEALHDLARRLDEYATTPLVDCVLGPVNPAPEKIFCIGLNYRKHAEETGGAPPREPVVFGKFGNALCAHGDPVPVAGHERMDYEAELGLMIGRTARNVSVEQALAHVLGYFCANDLSDRGLQFRSTQWLLGKTPDRFLPTGPFLRLAEPGFDPQALDIRCRLNGELRQSSNTADMIFTVAEIVAYLSRAVTLRPGDLVVTGTPEGVILGQPKPRAWMAPGDEVSVEIDGLGTLVNRLVDR